jgi:hypothetical protein
LTGKAFWPTDRLLASRRIGKTSAVTTTASPSGKLASTNLMLELPGQSERTIYGNAQSLVKLLEQFACLRQHKITEGRKHLRKCVIHVSAPGPFPGLVHCRKLRFYSMADVEKKRVSGEQPVAWPKAEEVSRALLARLRSDARRDSRQSP